MLFQVFKLNYQYLKRVCLGFVLRAIVPSDCFDPLELFPLMFCLAKANWPDCGTWAGLLCLKECVFVLFFWDLLVDPFCLVQNCTFRHYSPLRLFV